MTEDPCHSVELVHLAQAGDQNALNELFDRYYERVRSIVRLRLGKKLRLATESGDILQDTFAVARPGASASKSARLEKTTRSGTPTMR